MLIAIISNEIVNFIFSFFSVYAILAIDESFIFNSNSAKLLSREVFSKCFHYSFFFSIVSFLRIFVA